MLIDSSYRDIINFINPSDFSINSLQTIDWPAFPRFTGSVCLERLHDYFSRVTIKDFWVIYDNVPIQPFVKLNFSSRSFYDRKQINTMDGNQDPNFILSYDKNLNTNILYKNSTPQIMRIKRTGEFDIKVYDMNNNYLNIGNNGRIVFVVEIKPRQALYQPTSSERDDLIT